MNVLLINHYAGSPFLGMEYRPYYLAREWVKLGHHVTIVAASYSHVRSKQPNASDDISEDYFEGIRYLWLKTPPYQSNGIKRGLNILAFVGQIARFQDKLMKLHIPDLIICSSTHPLDVIPAKFLCARTGAKLVFEVHDIWPLSLIELGGMSPRHPFIVLLQWAENYAYRKADLVISMLPCAQEHMIAHGMRPDKFVHIPNGVDVSGYGANFVPLPQAHNQAIAERQQKGHFLVCYAGAHGVANSLDNLLAAAQMLKAKPVSVFLIGQGPEKERLSQLANEFNLENMIFLPQIPKNAVPSLLSMMDALYIGLKREPLFRFGVSPNKLMDYLMASKPILHAIDAGNDIIAEQGCGISIPSGEPEAIAQAIVDLIVLSPEERAKMGRKGKDYVIAHHDYRVLAHQFLDVISN